MYKNKLILTMLTFILTFSAQSAQAYIGPGAAVAFLGYAFGPVIAIIVSVGLVLAWIGRTVWKKLKKTNK